MVSQSKMRRQGPSSRSSGMDYCKAYENAIAHDLSDIVYVTPRMKKFLELKGIQYRVRYIF